MKKKTQAAPAKTPAARPSVVDDSILLSNRPSLRITDTTLRDAPQSLWATRIRTSDILEIIDTIDQAGYYSIECWGGATFDVCLRFLRENPWERLRNIKAHCKNTPLQMLIRGQNVLGYRNYADDLLERFIALAANNGMRCTWSDGVPQWLASRCTETETGARNLETILAGSVLPKLAHRMLERMSGGEMPPRASLYVDDDKSFALRFSDEPSEEQAEAPKEREAAPEAEAEEKE